MTLEDAVRMLRTTVAIEGLSSVALAADVQVAQANAHAGLPHKRHVTPAEGMNGRLELKPIMALLELARGTALNDDPSIASFARPWAALRYIGIFDTHPQTDHLRLDGAALQYIGANQRRVLSEDLGIGFGISVAKLWCLERNPQAGPIRAIDVDKALHNGLVPGLRTNGSRQPDYLLAYADPTNPSQLVYDLLETKGTTSRAMAKKQLARAVTQLAGLTIGGQVLTGMAVSTISNSDGVTIMAVDPEERPVKWAPTPDALQRSRKEPLRRRPRGEIVDVAANEFLATATNVDFATLAEYAGRQEAARQWLPTLSRERLSAPEFITRRETSSGVFIGRELDVGARGSSGRLRVFQGVAEEIAQGLDDIDSNAVIDGQRVFAEGRRSGDEEALDVSQGMTVASAVASDGAMLEIRLD